jgi:peptide chain release factor 1
MKDRIHKLLGRFDEVEELLGQHEVLADKSTYRNLTQEHSYILEIKNLWEKHQILEKELEENRALLKGESDADMISLIREEISAKEISIPLLFKQLETLLVPPDPRDSRSIIIEIRAGTGGDEAAIFVGDCVRMYKCYGDQKKWSHEAFSSTPSERGGYKEFVMTMSGHNVFRLMQYEAGNHRVQRVPDTESQGRIHTSAITVAILMEPDEDEKVVIDEKDLVIDTYRASGAGGQHVNTTDSAVRITHLPTGTVVTCQDERSQHKNKDKAMRLLSAKIVESKRAKEQQEIASVRSAQVGSGDRSERIRTYNFPQNRITDHRIDLTLYKLNHVINGDLDDLTSALVNFYYQKQLTSD